MSAIQVKQVVKQYKNGVQALNGISLCVERGEIFSLLGQNGAGKSTLLRILTTYLQPTSGRITMLGKDLCRDAASLRSQIACVAQQTSIDTYLSLEENMLLQSRLYRIPKRDAEKRMETLIVDFGLEPYRRYPVSSYSGGVKRRLDIALNMMTNPKILFLDEPTVGMDVQSRIAMWGMMRKIRDDFGVTIFLTTHYLEEADQLSNTVCIMKDGKEVTQGSPAQLRSLLRQNLIEITFSSEAEARKGCGILKEQMSKEILLRAEKLLIYTQTPQSDIEAAAAVLLKRHAAFQGIEIAQPTLEDVYLRLTQSERKECV